MIRWTWVKKELFRLEHIKSAGRGKPKSAIELSANECLARAKSLAKPRTIITRKAVRAVGAKSIDIDGPFSFSSNKLPIYLKGATEIYIFLVTIGDDIEKEASALMSAGESLAGYLLDRVGSLAVESMAEETELRLRRRYEAAGKSLSMRYSPGYCDWPIEEQKILSEVIDFSAGGVRLTENHVMVPKKSISAITAIGPKGLFKKQLPCKLCDLKGCSYRRS